MIDATTKEQKMNIRKASYYVIQVMDAYWSGRQLNTFSIKEEEAIRFYNNIDAVKVMLFLKSIGQTGSCYTARLYK